jgi:hypothetical protein
MNCDAFEIQLADYLDGTLPAADQLTLERHAESCANCREFMAQAMEGLNALKLVETVTPPPELVTRIAYLAPAGRVRHASEKLGFLHRMATRWLQPLLQPRLAMGMAMTFLSFTMMERCTGVHVRRIQAADLNPINIVQNVEDHALRLRDRAVKYYQNIRFVYDIEEKLRDLEDQRAQVEEDSHHPAAKQSAAAPKSSTGNTGNQSERQKEVKK